MSDLEYEVIDSSVSFKNKGYVDWVQDWSNWFYQPYPERNNDGDVVFLRSMPLSEGNYRNEALVMVGNEALEISEDQRVLLPIITATYVSDNLESPEYMYGIVRTHISNGDNPPHSGQVRINGKGIKISDEHIKKYEIETPVYHIHIPESSAGPSLKDKVELPIESVGYIPAVTRGYFVMLSLQPTPKDEYYFIECQASGMTTEKGPYNVSLFYQIKVNESSKIKRRDPLPERLNRNIGIKVFDKKEKGQVTQTEYDKIMKILEIRTDEKTGRPTG